MLKLLAFDLDDTLYSEQSYIRGGFREVSAYMQKEHNINAKEFYTKLIQTKNLTPSGKVFDIVLAKYKLSNQRLVEKLVEAYHSHSLRIRLYTGVRSIIKKLKKNYALALVTDGKQAVQFRKLVHLKIVDYFDAVIYTPDLGSNFKKPGELAFRRLLDTHTILPQEALYIGNNPDCDFIGAKKLGMKTVRVNQGICKGRNTDKLRDADFTIKSITQLPSLIIKIS